MELIKLVVIEVCSMLLLLELFSVISYVIPSDAEGQLVSHRSWIARSRKFRWFAISFNLKKKSVLYIDIVVHWVRNRSTLNSKETVAVWR